MHAMRRNPVIAMRAWNLALRSLISAMRTYKKVFNFLLLYHKSSAHIRNTNNSQDAFSPFQEPYSASQPRKAKSSNDAFL